MKYLSSLYIVLSLCLCSQAPAANHFTMKVADGMATTVELNATYKEATAISPFTSKAPISALCITGSITKQSDDYLVRVILKDNDGHEHCVLEAYNMVNDSDTIRFTDYCEETALLNSIVPDSLKIILHNATLELEKVTSATTVNRALQSAFYESNREAVRKSQMLSIVDRINAYNVANGRPWVAGETPLALMSYEDKRRLLGYPEDVSTDGYEYYYDGFFIVGNPDSGNRSATTSNYVSSFDWRNRHGKSWVTSVKDQEYSNLCFAFSSAGCLESLYMLYYNDTTSIDLSEAEIAYCSNQEGNPYNIGGYMWKVMHYLRDFGVHDESLQKYEFTNDSNQTCMTDYGDTNELVHIAGYDSLSIYWFDDSIKHWLINYGPLVSGYRNRGSLGHSMELVGYDKISYNSLVHFYSSSGLGNQGSFPTYLIGQTYWIFKNSQGGAFDTNLGGYQYIIFGSGGDYNTNNWFMKRIYHLCTPIISNSKTDDSIICEDADGDGYYFWGLRKEKLSSWPTWIPTVKDGDDSDSNKGKLYTYSGSNILIGDTEILNPDDSSPLVISGNSTFTTRNSIYTHITIASNATLTVKDILNLFGRVNITIQPGGQLIIDGGVITNANIIMSAGGKLVIKNGGTLVMRTNVGFSAPLGALVDIEEGQIIRSGDF